MGRPLVDPRRILYYRFTSVLLGAGFGGNLAISEARIGAAYKF